MVSYLGKGSYNRAQNMKYSRMASRFFVFLLIVSGFTIGQVRAAPVWYRCVVHAASHTGYYTFKIDNKTCAVYWHEVDSHLKIKTCKLPIIEALKPSARDEHTIVWFNMKTGEVYDYLSGFIDEGMCKVVKGPTKAGG